MPKHTCAFPSCQTALSRGVRYCLLHEEDGRADRREREKRYPSRKYQGLYFTQRWKARRRRQLIREPLCEECRKVERQELATVADHIEPHRGDEYLFFHGELQSLCDSCHSRKTREENGQSE